MVIEMTHTLKNACFSLKEKFLTDQKPENKRDPQFFEMVRKETEPLFDLIHKWEEETLAAIKQRQFHVHPQQIIATKENFELILMHSYYIDVKKQRYMELYQAIQYVFDLLLSH